MGYFKNKTPCKLQKNNEGFYVVDAQEVAATGIREDDVRLLRHDFNCCGCLIVVNLFTTEYINLLKLAFDKKIEQLTEGDFNKNNYVVGDKRFHITMSLESPFDDPNLYGHPLLILLMKMLLGPEVALDSYVAVQSLVGSANQGLHRDMEALFEDNLTVSGQLPPYAITVILPLVDVDQSCGMVLWSESHHNFGYSPVEHPGICPVVRRGSVYLWDYRLLHLGLANHSQRDRPIISLVYSKPWFMDARSFGKELPIYMTQSQYEKIPAVLKSLFV